MSKEKIRCFIGIEIVEKAVIERILSFQKAISEINVDLKLVEVENIHVTLRFLGEIPSNIVEKLSEELMKIVFNPFKIEFRTVGVFPNLRRINVIWIGINSGISELTEIFNQIESKLNKLGFRPDTRGFRPHVTVARVRSSRNKNRLIEAILNMRNKEFGITHVDSVKLKKSTLTPKGPIYSTLLEVRGFKK